MATTEQICKSIEKRLQAIETEVGSLNAALRRVNSRDGASGAATNGAGRARASAQANGRRRARPRRKTGTVSPGALEQLLGTRDGATTADLAAQLDADRAQVLAQLKQLEAEGKVRRTGERRAVRWHAITDEDRIRERAAELERRRRKPTRARAERA